MKKITIIILNYNGWQDTIECLNSLFDIDVPFDSILQVVVIDNGSTNESASILFDYLLNQGKNVAFVSEDDIEKTYSEDYIIIHNSTNYGFAGGNNIGLRFSKKNETDYFVLLNNDTIVTRGFLSPLLDILEKDENIGIVGPEIHEYYNRDEFILGGTVELKKCSGYHHYNTQKANKKSISFTSGCLWVIRREALEKCGYLDERFFLYVEDVDYCYRMIKCGYGITCTKDSVIYHKESRSTECKPSIYYYNTRNRFLFCKKHLNKAERVQFYIYFLLTRIIRMLTKPASFKYIWKGFIDFRKGRYGKYTN